jgi:hypothetical protein
MDAVPLDVWCSDCLGERSGFISSTWQIQVSSLFELQHLN